LPKPACYGTRQPRDARRTSLLRHTHLAAGETPQHWVFVDAFPLTLSGPARSRNSSFASNSPSDATQQPVVVDRVRDPIVNADVINVIDAGRVAESGTHRSLLRPGGVYASLYQEQFEDGKIQWQCTGGDIMADGTIRHRQTQPG
jgi:hypothetical protein